MKEVDDGSAGARDHPLFADRERVLALLRSQPMNNVHRLVGAAAHSAEKPPFDATRTSPFESYEHRR